MSTQGKLVRLGITSSALLGAAFFPQFAPALGIVKAGSDLGSLGVLLGALGSVAGGNVANAIDALTAGKDPDWVGLQNQDLTRAVGKAIGSVLMLVAKTTKLKAEGWSIRNQVKANLGKVARSAAENYVTYMRRENYSSLREETIEAIITPVLQGDPYPVLMSLEDWKDIFVWLNMKAKPGGGFFFPTQLYEEVAENLVEHFPKALLEVLKQDFAKDGRAYAALSLRLLTGLRTQLQSSTFPQLDPGMTGIVLERVAELEMGLSQRTEETFQAISTEIASGFTEVCRQLGVVTDGIDQLLAGQEAIQGQLDDIAADVKSLLANAQQSSVSVSGSISSNLPLSATSQFIGRQEQLDKLEELLKRQKRLAVCAVAGMGGIGKTELALQYALRYGDQYPGGLCWLSCRRAEVGLQLRSFGRSVLGLTIPEQGELTEQLAFCWNHWPEGDVLLIYDDVTDYSALQDYLPSPNLSRFTALLTSRIRPNRVSGIETVDLQVLSLPEALALLTSLAGEARLQAEPEMAVQLCEWVGCLPLALELLGAYLADEDITLSELWEELQTERLESEAFEALAGELRTLEGVVQTFELSWEALSSQAQELAVRLSLFAIAPLEWKWVAAQFPEEEQRGVKKCRERELLKRSLLQRTDKKMYELHPLLREFLVTKQRGMAEVDLDNMKRALGKVTVGIAQQVPSTVTLSDLAAVETPLPHLEQVAANLSDWLEEENEHLIWPFIALGRVYQGQSQFAQAERWYRSCVEVCESRLGDRHPDTATSCNNLADLYQSMGRYEEALPLYQNALEIYKEQLGDRHPSTATSYNNLAGLYESMGRYEEALPLYEKALEIWQSVLGNDHPNTQTVTQNYLRCLSQLPDSRLKELYPPNIVEIVQQFRQKNS